MLITEKSDTEGDADKEMSIYITQVVFFVIFRFMYISFTSRNQDKEISVDITQDVFLGIFCFLYF